jgi:hypothetical protein
MSAPLTPQDPRAAQGEARHATQEGTGARAGARQAQGNVSPPNAAERAHMDRIGRMPCVGCGSIFVELHHSLSAPGKRCRRDHRFVVPVCSRVPPRKPSGIHGLGSERTLRRAPSAWI